MIKGFRDFIMRGNVVDLAVGVVIGVAFNSLVSGFTTDFINPLIKFISGGKSFGGTVPLGHDGPRILWGDFITAVINFLIVAAVLYFLVVLPLNKLAERRNRGKAPEAAQISDEVALLMQIRDELVTANRPAPAQRTGGHRSAESESDTPATS